MAAFAVCIHRTLTQRSGYLICLRFFVVLLVCMVVALHVFRIEILITNQTKLIVGVKGGAYKAQRM